MKSGTTYYDTISIPQTFQTGSHLPFPISIIKTVCHLVIMNAEITIHLMGLIIIISQSLARSLNMHWIDIDSLGTFILFSDPNSSKVIAAYWISQSELLFNQSTK